MFAALLGVLGPLLGPMLERIIPDPLARQKFTMELFEKLQNADLAQLEVNKAEAASGSFFVAGWRPFVGWVCAVAFGLQYVIMPVSIAGLSFLGGVGVPGMDHVVTELLNAKQTLGLDDSIRELLYALLGLAGIRSFDKLKGIAQGK